MLLGLSVLGCSGIELFPDVVVQDATLEEARSAFRVPDGASHIYGLHRTNIDVSSTRICFQATPELQQTTRDEAAGKGATLASTTDRPPHWPDFPDIFQWQAPGFWPSSAAEVQRWEQGAGPQTDQGRGILWVFDGDQVCTWSWSFQHWTP